MGGAKTPSPIILKTLVTGAAGFLGRNIVQMLLARGEQVRALCRAQPPELISLADGYPDRLEIVIGDVRDAGSVDRALEAVDVVFHVAGVAGLWGPRDYYQSVNVGGTQNVVEASRRRGVGRLIYTSSPSVVFTDGDQCGADESLPYTQRWLCHYSQSKALAEQLALAANDLRGLQTCALRPHLIWGPGDRQLLPRLLAQARAGRLRRVGDGGNLIDIVYVDNAATAHLQAADALATNPTVGGRPYFISQGEPVNCWRWIDDLLTLASLPPVKCEISTAAAWRLGTAWETAYRLLRVQREPPMTRFLAAQLGRSHWFDISAARRDLGYNPAVSTAQGMRNLKEWFDLRLSDRQSHFALR